MHAQSDIDRLTALRDRLQEVLDDKGTSPRDLASVSREFRLLLETIDKARPSSGTTKLDEIAAKRKKREA